MWKPSKDKVHYDSRVERDNRVVIVNGFIDNESIWRLLPLKNRSTEILLRFPVNTNPEGHISLKTRSNLKKIETLWSEKRKSKIWVLTSRKIQVALTCLIAEIDHRVLRGRRSKLVSREIDFDDDDDNGISRQLISGFISVFLLEKEAEFISFFFLFSLFSKTSLLFNFISKSTRILVLLYHPLLSSIQFTNYFQLIYQAFNKTL